MPSNYTYRYALKLLSAKYPAMSPFTYTAGNPVMLVDPTGMGSEEIEWKPLKNLQEIGMNVWVAELGDDAKSLARDTGITLEKAEEVISQYTYITEGTAVIVPENQYKSNKAVASSMSTAIGLKNEIIEASVRNNFKSNRTWYKFKKLRKT